MNLKNKVLKNVLIDGIASEGKCVARYEGQVIFVNGVVPGDIVDLKVIRKKKSFLEAIVLEIKELSEKRSEPFCSHFGTCGGCKWQHMDYSHQLAYKEQQVLDNFQRIAKVDIGTKHPIISAPETQYYRNKLEFTFSNKRWLTQEEISSDQEINKNALGFHIPRRFDKILDIEHCYLQQDPSNKIRLAVRDYAIEHEISFFDLITQEGVLRNLIIRTTSIGELMVILQVATREVNEFKGVMEMLKSEFPEITSLNYIINTKKNDTFFDLDIVNYHGKAYIVEEMKLPDKGVVKFRIGSKSFFQTNSEQASTLYKEAWKMAALQPSDLVYDLYTGTGTIANYVAKYAEKVIGVEYVPEAIEDAKINSTENSIDNTSFFAGDMKDLLNGSFLEKNGKPDVIITDPPRAGMHPDVCQVILDAAPKRIVYISCNPATQARDVELLKSKYDVTEIQPVDMFPHTHHVECVILLELRK